MFLGPLTAYLLPIGRLGSNGGFTLLTDRAAGLGAALTMGCGFATGAGLVAA